MLLEIRLGLLVGLLPSVIYASSSSPNEGIAIPLSRHTSVTDGTFSRRSVLGGQMDKRTRYTFKLFAQFVT